MKKNNKKENSIFIKQNEPQILEMQAAAKMYYSSTPTISAILYVISIFICIISAFLNSNNYTNITLIILNISLIIGLHFIDNERNKAATIREYVDAYLYNIETDVKIEEVKELVLAKKRKYPRLMEVYCKNKGTDKPRGVKNWYSDHSNEEKYKEIILCQKENLFFDSKIRKKYLKVLIFLDILLLSLVVIISLKLNIISAVASTLSAIYENVRKTWIVCKLDNFYSNIYSYIDGCKEQYNEDDVIKIQKDINKRRRMNIDFFNSIHERFSNRIHEDYKYIHKNNNY